MREKGFPENVINDFRCDFASGTETVISFDQEGEMADLDLDLASTMTKEQIIECMGRFLSDSNIARLRGEEVD